MQRKLLIYGVILMMFLGLIYAWSLFAAPLEEAFNWSRDQTSRTFSISMVSFCLGSLASGFILKRHSLRLILLLSSFLFLVGFLWASRISRLEELYLSYGLLCGLGVGLSYNGLLASIPPLFGARLGTVSGGLLMGMGLGSLILGNLLEILILSLGISKSFVILALLFSSIFLLFAFIIKLPERGEMPVTSELNLRLAEVVKTRDFWLIFLWASLISLLGLSVVSNASFIVREQRLAPGLIAWAVGILSLGNGFGRLLFGKMGDLLGARRTMFISSIFYGLGSISLILGGPALVFIGFIFIGLAYSSSSVLSAYLVKKKYGELYYAQNLSGIILILIPASLLGPRLAALIFERFGSYSSLFPIMFILALVTSLPVLLIKEEAYLD